MMPQPSTEPRLSSGHGSPLGTRVFFVSGQMVVCPEVCRRGGYVVGFQFHGRYGSKCVDLDRGC